MKKSNKINKINMFHIKIKLIDMLVFRKTLHMFFSNSTKSMYRGQRKNQLLMDQ